MIDKEEILNLTDRGLEIFRYYMPINFTLKRNFRNPLYEDRKASCNIYYDRNGGCYKMKDFGDERYSGDCFWYVATLKGLNVQRDFLSVLEIICNDMRLDVQVQSSANESYRLSNTSKKKRETKPNIEEEVFSTPLPYDIKERDFSVMDISFWSRYGITTNVLLRYNVVAVDFFSSISRSTGKRYCITYSDTEPIYGYLSGECVKLYRPKSNLRFLYGGTREECYVFGLSELPLTGDVLFITGGEKDVLSLASHGFSAICFNSETCAISEEYILMLQSRFRHIILLYDMDDTGRKASLHLKEELRAYNVLRMELPLSGSKSEKDISDFFALGHTSVELRNIITQTIEQEFAQTLLLLQSCEINYMNPPIASNTIVSVHNVPLGTCDNLFCVTGGEGVGKSHFVSAIIAGSISSFALPFQDTLGLEVQCNSNHYAVLHYDTEQSASQLYKNITCILHRSGLTVPPNYYHPISLSTFSRKDRLKLIKESMDIYYHKHNGIQLVVIDGIADLIRSANDEAESVALVEELYRLAGMYHTCLLCVLHFIPNGVKLRGHIGSEMQRKSAGILSIERDKDPRLSVMKTLKVRDGSPLDVPLLQFGWDTDRNMHVFKGFKSCEKTLERKRTILRNLIRRLHTKAKLYTYSQLVTVLCNDLGIMEQTADEYLCAMVSWGYLILDSTEEDTEDPYYQLSVK